LGVYGHWNAWNWIDWDWEAAISGTPTAVAPGYSVLIAPSKEIKAPDFYIYTGLTYRGYFGSTLMPYTDYLSTGGRLSETETDLFDEDLDTDSWRTVMAMMPKSVHTHSGAARFRGERLLYGNVWAYLDAEAVRVMPEFGLTATTYLLSSGIKLAFSQHHFGYIGVQNKFLNTVTVSNGSDNTPFLVQRSPVIVGGIKFKF
jgi:hypothetical protein